MSDPVGDPNLFVHREAGQGVERLEMSDVAVQGWIRAYRKYAQTLIGIAEDIEQRDRVTNFGNLDSLRQLASGYDQLLYGGEGSVYQRVLEFADAANQFADKLYQDWLTILTEDGKTSSSLSTLGTPS